MARSALASRRTAGLTDKASASGAGDPRFESWAGQCFCEALLFPPRRGVEHEPLARLEPTTFRLLSGCSANEAKEADARQSHASCWLDDGLLSYAPGFPSARLSQP